MPKQISFLLNSAPDPPELDQVQGRAPRNLLRLRLRRRDGGGRQHRKQVGEGKGHHAHGKSR